MLLDIKKYGDPILREEAEDVGKITMGTLRLITDMIETMYQAQGVGLAAPQVGISKKIVVVDVGEGVRVLINPEIIKRKGSQKIEEGCLSLPGIRANIKRAKEIEYKTMDKNGKIVIKKASGLLAQVIQHETDHLYGKLIIDRISFWERRKLKGTIKKIEKSAK